MRSPGLPTCFRLAGRMRFPEFPRAFYGKERGNITFLMGGQNAGTAEKVGSVFRRGLPS